MGSVYSVLLYETCLEHVYVLEVPSEYSEGGVPPHGRPSLRRTKSDCLAEALTKEGGDRPNGRPALRRTNTVCLAEALTKEGCGRPNGCPALRRTKNDCLAEVLTKEGGGRPSKTKTILTHEIGCH